MIQKHRLREFVLLVPITLLVLIGGPWAKSESLIPRRPTWNVIAPEGTVTTVIESSRDGIRLSIDRVNKRIKDNIRIERKLTDRDAKRGAVIIQVNADPARDIQGEIYKHHAPWPVLARGTMVPGRAGAKRVELTVAPTMVRMDGAVVFSVEPKLGIIEIQDLSDDR